MTISNEIEPEDSDQIFAMYMFTYMMYWFLYFLRASMPLNVYVCKVAFFISL